MKLWRYAVLAYAVLYFVLAGTMEAENLNLSYPAAYVAFSMIAQIFMVCGIILFAIEARAEFANVWRLLFPLLVLELALGILFDVTYQSDLNNLWMNELFGLWLAAPAQCWFVQHIIERRPEFQDCCARADPWLLG